MKSRKALIINRQLKALPLAPLIFCLSFLSGANDDVNWKACAKYLEPSLLDKLSGFFDRETNTDLNREICTDLVNAKDFKEIDTDYKIKSLSDSEFRSLISSRDSSVSSYGQPADFNTLQNSSATFKVIGSTEPSESDGQDNQDIETVRGFSTIQN